MWVYLDPLRQCSLEEGAGLQLHLCGLLQHLTSEGDVFVARSPEPQPGLQQPPLTTIILGTRRMCTI